MWAYESTIYQIYPLGLCGAPAENDGVLTHRITKVLDWVPHIKSLGVGAVLFNPLFSADRHGYDTRDFLTVDCRLGTNGDFKAVCAALHQNGLTVMLDAVFNHVGRGFWAFQDVLKNRESSSYKDWFHINFGGNSGDNDGLWYEGWEGHFELVKLNLRNPQVVDYLLSCVGTWVAEFGIDGLRLDVAYCLEPEFLKALRRYCDQLKPDFFLFGEILGGDYKRILSPEMLPSCTNYECFKGLWSSFNDKNLFELAHSLNRMFSGDPYALYPGAHLVSFTENHDVTRLATNLKDPADLPLVYGALFAMPGVPILYYGGEWGAPGDKKSGDAALRPCFDGPMENDLTATLTRLIAARKASPALCHGSFQTLVIQNRQLVFLRQHEGERVLFAVNLDDAPAAVTLGNHAGPATDLCTGEALTLAPQQPLPPKSAHLWRLG